MKKLVFFIVLLILVIILVFLFMNYNKKVNIITNDDNISINGEDGESKIFSPGKDGGGIYVNDGIISGGKGGKSLFGKNGESEDIIIIKDISIKECLEQNKINIEYDRLSYSKVKKEIYLYNDDKLIKVLPVAICESKK